MNANEYLSKHGNVNYYHVASGYMRVGQAFYYALTGTDRARLRNSDYDPFYSDSRKDVQLAVDFLVYNA